MLGKAKWAIAAVLAGGLPCAGTVELPTDYLRANVERQVVNLSGHLEPFERVVLPARVEGYLKTIRVDLGDSVRKGEVLAEVDVPELIAQVRMAEAGLAQARARLAQAEAVRGFKARIASRLPRLARERRGTVTAEEMDRADDQLAAATAEVKVRQAAVKVALARLENSQARLAFSRIRAPFDGVVTRRLVHTGALLAPSTGIVELVRVDRLRLVVEVPQRIAPYLRLDDPLRVRFKALPGKVFSARLSRLGALLSEGKMRAEADLSQAPGLIPGMAATVAVRLW